MDAHIWSEQSVREGSSNSGYTAFPVNFMAMQVASAEESPNL